MPKRNHTTTLRRRHGTLDQHDNLPDAARAWVMQAALPWSSASVARLWGRAMRDTGNVAAALARLDAAEARRLEQDRPRIWGNNYPIRSFLPSDSHSYKRKYPPQSP